MNQIADIKPDASSRRSPYFSEEHEMLRAQVRRFVETEIKPHALAWEEQGYVPREVLRRMGSLGFLGIRYPARYGGSEMDTLATVVLAEELGRSTFSGVAITVARPYRHGLGPRLQRSGSEAQKDKWMPGIIAGEVITAVAVTEPDAGSDVKGIRTFARRDGDSYVLNGAKMFITNGVHADLYCVAAKTDRAGAPSRSMTMFLVEKGTPGFTRQPRARQAWLALVRHRRTAFRRLPHSGREPCSARKAAASTRSWATSRTSASSSARWRWARRRRRSISRSTM